MCLMLLAALIGGFSTGFVEVALTMSLRCIKRP